MTKLTWILFFMGTVSVSSQVGIETLAPSPVAALEINAGVNGDYKGFLPPRVPTIADQESIAPAIQDVGLLVFVEETACLDVWNGTAWEHISCSGGVTDVWVNEFHYADGDGDNSEFIEIAGVAGTNVEGYYITRYNGSTGFSYGFLIPLSGVIPDEENGLGTLSFDVNELQNAIDGFALVDADGKVIQFLSYEGSFPAIGGPANALGSSDVLITQNNTTANTQSIHLTGSGTTAADFTWSLSASGNRTPGTKNVGQTFN